MKKTINKYSTFKRLFENISLAYIPCAENCKAPGDRRRFIFFAKTLDIKYEIYNPKKIYNILVATESADPKIILDLPKETILIYDFIDAFLSENLFSLQAILRGSKKYFSGESKKFYLNYKNAYKDILRRSNYVICSTEEQVKFIKPFCKNVQVLIDAHFDDCYKIKKIFDPKSKKINIAWEGSNQTLKPFIKIAKEISKTEIAQRVHYHVVTDEKSSTFLNKLKYGKSISRFLKKQNLPFSFYEWDVKAINNLTEICDIAIVPIDTKKKINFLKSAQRLLLFWRLGLPVIASNNPAHKEFMNKVQLNLCASSKKEWVKYIKEFIDNPKLVKNNSLVIQKYVACNLTKDSKIKEWVSLFEKIISIMKLK